MILDHIALAVQDFEQAASIFKTLGFMPAHREEIPGQGVEVLIFPLGYVNLELIKPIDQASPLRRFLEKRGEGLHHIAFSVLDIYDALQRCREAGLNPIDAEPRLGAEGKLIAFLNPKNTLGTLIELCQRE